MSDLAELAKALVAFQKVVPTIEKNRIAKIPTKSGPGYSYKYADLADIWAAVRQPLADNKLAVTQLMTGGSDGYTGLRTTIWHESGQFTESVLEIPTQGKSAQEAGSLFTYYKRYALGAALGISTEDDDDGAAGNTPPEAKPKASAGNAPSDKQINLIRLLSDKAGLDKAVTEMRIKTIETSQQASEAIEKLNALVAKKEAQDE